ncbi:hypothetical protein ACFWXK_24915 [Streptomyces sp. NPDC059070]|uniref:hypothetical protein n=1 Tax=Streptomyces sp. NPDC059070 TaxID=3346713 RepID=UPI00367C5241
MAGVAGARFFASDEKATRRPSFVIVAPAESPSPWVPSLATLTRSTDPEAALATPATVMGPAEAAPGSVVVTAQATSAAGKTVHARLMARRFVVPLILPPKTDTALLPGSPPGGHKHAIATAL